MSRPTALMGMVMGIAVGLFVGWLLWSHGEPLEGHVPHAAFDDTVGPEVAPSLAASGSAPSGRAEPSSARPNERARDVKPTDDESAPPDRSAIFRAGSKAAVYEASLYTTLTDAEVDALISRLEDVRAKKSQASFRNLLGMLGASGHPKAEAHLISLAGDVDADLPPDFAETVQKYLVEAKTAGAAAAALARIGAGQKSTHWLPIIMLRGSSQEIEKAFAFTGRRIPHTAAYSMLMARPLAEARQYLRRAQAIGPPQVNVWRVLDRFVHHHRKEGRALLLAAILAMDAERDPGINGQPAGQLLRTYLQSVPRERDWPETARVLAGLRTERMRLAAVAALQLAQYRGFDLKLVSELLEQPGVSMGRLLETRPPASDVGKRLRYLSWAVENNRAALTEGNVRALEYAAEHWSGERKDEIQRAARACRAALTNKGWR